MTNRGAQRGRDPPRTRPAAAREPGRLYGCEGKKKERRKTEEPKMCSLLEFNMLGQKTEREIKARALGNKDAPDNVDKHTGSGCSQ